MPETGYVRVRDRYGDYGICGFYSVSPDDGVLEDFLLEMKTGRIQSLLVAPAESVESRLFKTDPRGRLILSFRSMKAVRDVIVTQLAD